MKKIALIGNPNVGKSAVFSKLTGTKVIISNYHGSTVEYKKGETTIHHKKYKIIDTPGIYSLEGISEAEKVATKLANKADIIINVLDATNLERNLYLTMHLIKLGKPMIIVLNMWDESKHLGIKIDRKKLEKILGIKVIPTVAVIGEGIKDLAHDIKKAEISDYEYFGDIWANIGYIIENVQKLTNKKHTLLEKISDIMIKPITGIPISIFIILASFKVTRLIGETLISQVLSPLYDIYSAHILTLMKYIKSDIIIKILFGVNTDPMAGFGILTAGIYIPIVVVLPYIFAFYLLLSLLEDSGYLPRLAILMDNILHKLGLYGYGTIPIILGLGCKVPAILATKVLETKREKIIATLLILLVAHCMPQTAMIVSILARFGLKYIILTFAIITSVGLISGYFLNKILKGNTPELFIEIPPIRKIRIKMLAKKTMDENKRFYI